MATPIAQLLYLLFLAFPTPASTETVQFILDKVYIYVYVLKFYVLVLELFSRARWQRWQRRTRWCLSAFTMHGQPQSTGNL
jgi:hypothetical protein